MILNDETAKELFEEACEVDIETASNRINNLIEDDVFSGSSSRRSLDLKYMEKTKNKT